MREKQDSFYTIDGLQYPRVTKILKVIDKPMLNYWRKKTVMEYLYNNIEELSVAMKLDKAEFFTSPFVKSAMSADNVIRDKAAGEGTDAHGLVQAHLEGHPIEAPVYDEGTRNAFEAYLKWRELEGKHYKLIINELLVWNKEYCYAGKIDSVGMLNGKLVIVDFKTNKGGIYPEHNMQVAAYHACPLNNGQLGGDFSEAEKHGAEECWILHLSKETGDYTFGKVENLDKHFETFKACLTVYNWLEWLKKNGK